MRVLRLLGLVSVFCFASTASAQQAVSATPTSGPQSPQAAAIIQQSIAAMTGGAAITDVTATGTITIVKSGGLASSAAAAGQPTSESGTVTLVATASGQGKNTSAIASGTSVTIQDISQSAPALQVTGKDGLSHTIQTASALTPHPGWFYPAYLLTSGLSASYAVSYVGHETWQGVAVEHLAIWRTSGSASAAPLLQQASQHDVYLDSKTLLPVALTFIAHPFDPSDPSRTIVAYRRSTPDRLTVVQFSDYRAVQGQLVAFHLRSSMTILPFDTSNDLVSDMQISSLKFSTGVTIPALAATN